jgi:MinD-like ATPase involved in chromosome partitioning or flagellar assembly
MKLISIHSHKGGAGKTTIALLTAQAQFKSGARVCTVDLDFLGSGLEAVVDARPQAYLDDFLVKLPSDPSRPTVSSLITVVQKTSTKKQEGSELSFIFKQGE